MGRLIFLSKIENGWLVEDTDCTQKEKVYFKTMKELSKYLNQTYK